MSDTTVGNLTPLNIFEKVNMTENMTHTEPQYEKSCCEIRLVGEVNNQTVFTLCDEIDLAIDYYQYKIVEIQIDSPGGAIASLDYYLSKLERWKKKGILISTLGLTSVASAAAMILSLGTIGYRRAYSSSQLLYHNARISKEKFIATKEGLISESKALELIDNRLQNRLVDHIFDNKINKSNKITSMAYLDYNFLDKKFEELTTPIEATGISKETLKLSYTKLNSFDTFISPNLAKEMFLIDEIQEVFEFKGDEAKLKGI